MDASNTMFITRTARLDPVRAQGEIRLRTLSATTATPIPQQPPRLLTFERLAYPSYGASIKHLPASQGPNELAATTTSRASTAATSLISLFLHPSSPLVSMQLRRSSFFQIFCVTLWMLDKYWVSQPVQPIYALVFEYTVVWQVCQFVIHMLRIL